MIKLVDQFEYINKEAKRNSNLNKQEELIKENYDEISLEGFSVKNLSDFFGESVNLKTKEDKFPNNLGQQEDPKQIRNTIKKQIVVQNLGLFDPKEYFFENMGSGWDTRFQHNTMFPEQPIYSNYRINQYNSNQTYGSGKSHNKDARSNVPTSVEFITMNQQNSEYDYSQKKFLKTDPSEMQEINQLIGYADQNGVKSLKTLPNERIEQNSPNAHIDLDNSFSDNKPVKKVSVKYSNDNNIENDKYETLPKDKNHKDSFEEQAMLYRSEDIHKKKTIYFSGNKNKNDPLEISNKYLDNWEDMSKNRKKDTNSQCENRSYKKDYSGNFFKTAKDNNSENKQYQPNPAYNETELSKRLKKEATQNQISKFNNSLSFRKGNPTSNRSGKGSNTEVLFSPHIDSIGKNKRNTKDVSFEGDSNDKVRLKTEDSFVSDNKLTGIDVKNLINSGRLQSGDNKYLRQYLNSLTNRNIEKQNENNDQNKKTVKDHNSQFEYSLTVEEMEQNNPVQTIKVEKKSRKEPFNSQANSKGNSRSIKRGLNSYINLQRSKTESGFESMTKFNKTRIEDKTQKKVETEKDIIFETSPGKLDDSDLHEKIDQGSLFSKSAIDIKIDQNYPNTKSSNRNENYASSNFDLNMSYRDNNSDNKSQKELNKNFVHQVETFYDIVGSIKGMIKNISGNIIKDKERKEDCKNHLNSVLNIVKGEFYESYNSYLASRDNSITKKSTSNFDPRASKNNQSEGYTINSKTSDTKIDFMNIKPKFKNQQTKSDINCTGVDKNYYKNLQSNLRKQDSRPTKRQYIRTENNSMKDLEKNILLSKKSEQKNVDIKNHNISISNSDQKCNSFDVPKLKIYKKKYKDSIVNIEEKCEEEKTTPRINNADSMNVGYKKQYIKDMHLTYDNALITGKSDKTYIRSDGSPEIVSNVSHKKSALKRKFIPAELDEISISCPSLTPPTSLKMHQHFNIKDCEKNFNVNTTKMNSLTSTQNEMSTKAFSNSQGKPPIKKLEIDERMNSKPTSQVAPSRQSNEFYPQNSLKRICHRSKNKSNMLLMSRMKHDPLKIYQQSMQKSISFKSSDFFSDQNLDDSISKNDYKQLFKQDPNRPTNENLSNVSNSIMMSKSNYITTPESLRLKTKHELEVENFQYNFDRKVEMNVRRSNEILVDTCRKSDTDIKIRRLSPEATPLKKTPQEFDSSFSNEKNLFFSPGHVDDLSNFIDEMYTKSKFYN